MAALKSPKGPHGPGDVLRDQFLGARLTPERLAAVLGEPVQVVHDVVKGRASVDAALALKLGAALGTSAEWWLDMQSRAELHRARCLPGSAEQLAAVAARSRGDARAPE